MENDINIVPFAEKLHAPYFKSLNESWLKQYFKIEPLDHQILNYPKKEIIDRGGYIFMMFRALEIIGTFALLKKEEGVFEFNKMAIREDFRGKGYGTHLMQFALHFTDQHHWKKLLLYSNTKLENSIYLYRKFGFKEVPLDNAPYARGNIKMELELKEV